MNALPKLTAAAVSPAVCLALAACAVAPDYKKPEADLAPFHNAAKVVVRDTSQPETPPSLVRIVAIDCRIAERRHLLGEPQGPAV